MAIGVVHVGTGFVGTEALRGVIEHPDLELRGLVVHAREKVGRDAGELAGLKPVGVQATSDLDEALRAGADVVSYFATTHGRLKATIEEFCHILESGANIITTSVGAPIDSVPPIVHPDGLRANWGGVVTMIADQLGCTIDEVATSHELLAAPEAFRYQGRTIEQGTIAGLRFEVAGLVAGRTVVSLSHVTRAKRDLAPDWPRPLRGDAYRIVIEGEPRLDCEFEFSSAAGGNLAGGFGITAMRAVNAIAPVVAAAPGVASVFDLPLITGRGRLA